jgi:bifunctional enzyme CysN/CysC
MLSNACGPPVISEARLVFNLRHANLNQDETVMHRKPVRIVIVGDVDHGKSTLIGRLLHETGSLPDGKLEMLQDASARRSMPFEWSFLLDALQTERDQGITIDTTQIRFRTAAREVVLIDAPGHTEFLRNMITGAAQADAAVLLIDAAEGVRDQTRRHGYLLHLLGVHQVAVVINKMDRVDFNEARFRDISTEMSAHLTGLGVTLVAVIPISARDGDGVAAHTARIGWYDGPTVVEALDRFTPAHTLDELPLRLPVQAIYKFDERRIIAGRISSGVLCTGDEIVIMPAGKIARVKTLEAWPTGPAAPQGAGRSVGMTLDRELFLERGDIVAHAGSAPTAARRLHVRIFWLHDSALTAGSTVLVRLGTRESRATVVAIANAVDPGDLASVGTQAVARNHVGEIELALAQPMAADAYDDNPSTGRLVIEINGRIAGGGLVLSADAVASATPIDIVPVASALRADERAARYRHGGAVVWLTGLPGSGKSTLARALERKLFDRGGVPVLLDGDTLRDGLNIDLGFSAADRSENIRRLAEVAAHLARNGHIAIVAAVSPSQEDRKQARLRLTEHFYEIYVSTSQQVCEMRDPKGHYRKARAGRLPGFTGVGQSYQHPVDPDLTLDCGVISVEAAADAIELLLIKSGLVF